VDSQTGTYRKLSALLAEIEAELVRLGMWREDAIDPFGHLEPGRPRSFLTASSFEDWLQFVFLPAAAAAIEARRLPATSQVGLMARRQWDYHSSLPEAGRVIRLLDDFDSLVEQHGSGVG